MDDLISRQAALALAKDICVPTKDGTVYRHRCIDPQQIMELPSAQPDVPDADGDMISRKLMCDLGATCIARRDDDGKLIALGRIDMLPSAQPYSEAEIQKMQELEQAEIQKAYELGREEGQKEAQPEHRWIPCKTALPEKGQYVLCQCRVGIMDVLHLTDDNGWYKDSTHIYMHGFVLAWMPLPEPYRSKEEKDDNDSVPVYHIRLHAGDSDNHDQKVVGKKE